MPHKPFLRWAGSKRQSLAVLSKFWKLEYSRYVEPFAGSAALFFSLHPLHALLSDSNCALIETFTAVRDDHTEVATLLHSFPRGRDAFYEIRSIDPLSLPSINRAARFIYLNRYCFNGLYRTNRAGQFNVPYAASRTGSLPTPNDLFVASEILQNAVIRCTDFESTLAETKEGDFVYLDPPFAVRNRRIFKQYGPDVFGTEDLARLSRALLAMADRGVHFVVSYAECDEATHYLSDWPCVRISVQRNIAGFAKHRRADTEVIYTNTPLPEIGHLR